jgi:hypothetical protein
VPGITVSTIIDAPPRVVWASVRDIGSHVGWMADAEAIRFTSRRRTGVGTTFECDTRVGPLTLTDVMEVTSWVERREMGVRHTGVVTGTGRFTLRRARGGRTRFTWEERLVFPWWLGGRVGGVVGARVLKQIWKGNLRRLAAGFTR